jgi:hypothetical protein
MIYETFAYRKRRQDRSGEPEIYTYDQAPEHLRHQICTILSDGIGEFNEVPRYGGYTSPNANGLWSLIDKICCKEIYSYIKYIPAYIVLPTSKARYLGFLRGFGHRRFPQWLRNRLR